MLGKILERTMQKARVKRIFFSGNIASATTAQWLDPLTV